MKEKISQNNQTTEAISTATRTRSTSALTRKGERTLSWSSMVVKGVAWRGSFRRQGLMIWLLWAGL